MYDNIDENHILAEHYSCIKEKDLSPERKKALRDQFLRKDYPFSIALELGEFPCTHRCRMCPQSTIPFRDSGRFMDEKTFELILDRIDPDRELSLEISALGETFLHPKALEFIVRAKMRLPKAKLTVATNGLLLTEPISKGLVEANIDFIQVSLNTGSADSYEWFCGRKDYSMVANNLDKLIELRNRTGSSSKVTTHIIEIEELKDEFLSFVTTWRNRADNVYIRGYGNWGGMVKDNGLHGLHPLPQERYPCVSLFCALEILSDATAYKCFLHGVPGANKSGYAGSLVDQSIEDIWTGPLMEQYRTIHLKDKYGDLPYCRECTSWSLFPNVWEKRENWGKN